MYQIKDAAGQVKSGVVVLKAYFGQHPGQSLAEFSQEVKALSEASRDELVIGAAKELGYRVEEVEVGK